ncbi:unnamed protein product [Gongylonema pulchrum]|uniref:PIGO_PIGG domain-containing protein n=1 Tax=Gongylonema pulchrum TaxID=637853 RepID=A0A183CZ76_9BILA|nr:unnamed protein product [Gongylonema pulchrum]
MRTYNLPLAALQLLIGHCLRQIDAHPLMLVLAAYSSLFYSGNSNSLSTIDVSVGYVSVKTYQPILIAVQILLNTYSGPMLIIFAWWQASVRFSTDFTVFLQKAGSLLGWACAVAHSSMSACLLSIFIQRYHLFVWSVFAPKFLYELAHLLVLTVVALTVYGYDRYYSFIYPCK